MVSFYFCSFKCFHILVLSCLCLLNCFWLVYLHTFLGWQNDCLSQWKLTFSPKACRHHWQSLAFGYNVDCARPLWHFCHWLLLGISSSGSHCKWCPQCTKQQLSAAAFSRPCPKKAHQESAPPPGLPKNITREYSNVLLRKGRMLFLLPTWDSPRNCYALFTKPELISLTWLVYYISEVYPITEDPAFTYQLWLWFIYLKF